MQQNKLVWIISTHLPLSTRFISKSVRTHMWIHKLKTSQSSWFHPVLPGTSQHRTINLRSHTSIYDPNWFFHPSSLTLYPIPSSLDPQPFIPQLLPHPSIPQLSLWTLNPSLLHQHDITFVHLSPTHFKPVGSAQRKNRIFTAFNNQIS